MNWQKINSSTREAYTFGLNTLIQKYSAEEWVAFVDGETLFYPTKEESQAACEKILKRIGKF